MNKLLSFKKPTRLQSRPPSMDVQSDQKQNNIIEKEEELSHFSHPEHKLIAMNVPYLFICMACKECGGGNRFMCQNCGFYMNEFCALAPQSLHNHPFHPDHQLDFTSKPGVSSGRSKCAICGKPAKGYAFRCKACVFEMHPCCATMCPQMNFQTHEHTLFILNIEAGESNIICNLCRKKRSGQVYQCIACRYFLHAVCAKDMVNGVYVHGSVGAPAEKSSRIVTVVKLVLHLLFGAIGGLVDGIGEGIGEGIGDSIGNFKGTRSRSVKQK